MWGTTNECSAIRSVSDMPRKRANVQFRECVNVSEVVWWTGKLIRMQRVQVFSDWCQLVSHPIIREREGADRLTKVRIWVLRIETAILIQYQRVGGTAPESSLRLKYKGAWGRNFQKLESLGPLPSPSVRRNVRSMRSTIEIFYNIRH